MRIHLISCHAVLEHDLLQLLSSIGHDVFSNGAYLRPEGHYLLSRPGVPEAKYFPHYEELARKFSINELPPELINPFDVLIFMHHPIPLVQNWPNIKHKKVIFYSIGQNTQGVEEMLAPMRAEGLKIIRMSPKECNIQGYIGSDALIRFPKDPDELKDWDGSDKTVINFTQSLKGRRNFCHYDHLMELASGYPTKFYGSGNEDLGNMSGGELTWDLMKGKMRSSRVFIYGGTWPAPYTLSFEEAMMIGMPIVAIGRHLAEGIPGVPQLDFYEVSDIIKNGENGFVSDDMSTLRSYIYQLLNDDALAKSISVRARETAITYFGRAKIAQEWRDFLNQI